MGITSRLVPSEVTTLCDTVKDPEDSAGDDGIADIDRFARFMRATKAPPRDARLAETADAQKGSRLFDSVGCADVPRSDAGDGTGGHGGRTAAPSTVPPALGGKVFHPFGDFLLHDVGTGDGIALATVEHFGAALLEDAAELRADRQPDAHASPVGSAHAPTADARRPVARPSRAAILRHRGEASVERRKFLELREREKQQLLAFLRSL